jgi:hypothetical protein
MRRSPTDTKFSGCSLFDKSYRDLQGLGSPNSFRDNVSDVTSVTEHGRSIKQPVFQLKAESLHSHKPESDVDDSPVVAHQLAESSTPRLVTILSCIQCILASLPCSRTTPSCTRCIRNNTATSCLLQRRLFPKENTAAPVELCTIPVLLKLDDENEGIWVEKMAAMQRLMEMWEDKKDRGNWILPRIETEERGGWRGQKKKNGNEALRSGFGEGIGRIRCEELVLEEVTF